MSPTKKDRKIQPLSGKDIPERPDDFANQRFAQVIADALRREFDGTHVAIKTVAKLTMANERAVKNWFMAKNGPTGRHLVDLMRTSNEVLEAVLLMSGRQELVSAKKITDSRQVLIKMLRLIDDLQSESRIPNATTITSLEELERGEGETFHGSTRQLFDELS